MFQFQQYQLFLQKYINQTYQLIQILVLQINQIQQYFIGYNNQQLDIFTFDIKFKNYSYQFQLKQSINISVNAISLQVAYSIYPDKLIIGLSTNDSIYLIQYNYDKNSIISSNYTFVQQFSDFIVTYNSIIILISIQEIQILTFNYTVTYTLNQQSINKLFNNITFNPIQIVVNTQSVSSFVYINNINEIIIISIDQNSYPIPISLIQVNFTIKQINLVNQQLILSYICNNQNNICFQVWNVQNLPKYYYVKNLYNVNFDNNIIIQSDNLFFYVTFSNYTVYVYNPSLPYHMSLYYKLELTSPIQCTEQFYLNNPLSVIIANNYLYTLSELQQFNLTVQQSNYVFNNSISYPQLTYNYTVTSALNNNTFQQTPNQSIIFYLNFTQFQDLRNLSIELSKDNIIPYSKNFSYPMNLILDRQVGYCYLNQSITQNKYCSLTQFLQYYYPISNIQNYSLITSINNEYFALQSNSFIQTLSSDLRYLFYFNYTNLTFSQCLQSTSYIYQLYSICQNSTSQYLLNFTLNSSGNIVNLNTTQLPQTFSNISKMSSILNQIFILGNQKEQLQQLYWFNQSNRTLQVIINYCQDFSIAQIPKVEDNQQESIIIFFIYYQQLEYKIISIVDDIHIFHQAVILQINIIDSSYYLQQYYYFQILILQIYSKKAIVLVSDKYLSYIIYLRIQSLSQKLQIGTIFGTIPNYGNLTIAANSFYQNGVLMQQFNDQGQFIVGVYYLNNLFDQNLMEPILMQSSFNTTNRNYAMIVNQQYQIGTSLYISKESIQNYPISNWNLNCISFTNNQSMNIQLFCQNQFSNGIYDITFHLPPKFHFYFSSSAYALFSIIILLIIFFYIRFIYKTRNLGYINAEIEL
ncbi:unnamed protein product [Paramecium primaurelia]|uniref:Transmembrane protein n=1 Tax=Paramecium primaurelia TaxID=5886 RepID=A0A8S1LBS0_PARPR|nr:unnamed protein product [Paramecium primaurelia]